MTTALLPTDRELLQKLLLGQLPSAEAERLAAKYADDSRLAAVADSIAAQDDTLLNRLKNQETALDSEAEILVARLVQRLTLALPLAHDTAVMSPTDATLPPSGPAAPGSQTLPLQLEYYTPLKVLGQGGMGTVYLALDTRLGREVAIKTLRPELAANPQAKERFLREARTAAKLGHDHIIPIYYVGEADGTPFLAMPLLKGEPLDAYLKRTGPLPVAEAVRIALETASALAAAHAAGLIHRDIKPANIWLEAPNGRVKVLDFGLAKSATPNSENNDDTDLTAFGAIVGTPAYMAPEQAGGKPVDARADLFSLGCVLYEMLAGKRPFAGPDTMSILMSLASHTPPAPHTLQPQCPATLSQLVMQLLEKDCGARPASAQTVIEALDVMDLAPPVERPGLSTAKPQAVEKNRFNRRASLGLAIALLALLPLGYLFGAQIIRIVTNQGQIVIETDGAGIEVIIKDGEGKVLDKATAQSESRHAAIWPRTRASCVAEIPARDAPTADGAECVGRISPKWPELNPVFLDTR